MHNVTEAVICFWWPQVPLFSKIYPEKILRSLEIIDHVHPNPLDALTIYQFSKNWSSDPFPVEDMEKYQNNFQMSLQLQLYKIDFQPFGSQDRFPAVLQAHKTAGNPVIQ